MTSPPYVNHEERREVFKRETVQAWEEYQTTGLHASAEEVEQWLTSWGTDEERPAPECQR